MTKSIRAKDIKVAVGNPRTWIEPAARIGFAAKALIYATVGILAGMYALHIGGRPTDVHGALEEYTTSTVGMIVLVLLAIGFTLFAAWRVAQSLADTDNKGSDLKGLGVRASYLGSALISGWLSYTAVQFLFGEKLGDDEGAEGWTARILSAPFGPQIVIAIGSGIVLFGLWQFYKAFSEKYRKRLETERMNNTGRAWMQAVSKFGLSARGVIYVLAGGFVISAAVNIDPSEARDIGDVLATVAAQPYGDPMLLLLAIGLLAYAALALVNAVYRRV